MNEQPSEIKLEEKTKIGNDSENTKELSAVIDKPKSEGE